MDIRRVARYTTAAQEALNEYIANYSDACLRRFETTAVYPNIDSLLAHVTGAERRWIARIQGRPQPPRFEETPGLNTAAIVAGWREQRDETLSIIHSASPEELQRVVAVKLNSSDFSANMTVEEILFHVFNHEGYHRGQISMMLQMQQLDPPNFDFILFMS